MTARTSATEALVRSRATSSVAKTTPPSLRRQHARQMPPRFFWCSPRQAAVVGRLLHGRGCAFLGAPTATGECSPSVRHPAGTKLTGAQLQRLPQTSLGAGAGGTPMPGLTAQSLLSLRCKDKRRGRLIELCARQLRDALR